MRKNSSRTIAFDLRHYSVLHPDTTGRTHDGQFDEDHADENNVTISEQVGITYSLYVDENSRWTINLDHLHLL